MKPYVILLHGLGKTSRSMSFLQQDLSRHFCVINVTYPSYSATIEILAIQTIAKALKSIPNSAPVFFVTHSMGGILLRQYLKHYSIPNLSRVVMLGPPNQGSEVVNYMDLLGMPWITGPAGGQIGIYPDSIPAQLNNAPLDCELGIIAGTRTMNPLLSAFILPGRNDGKVTVESTVLQGMKAHLTLPVTHPFMAFNKQVIFESAHFLLNGHFSELTQK